MTKTRRFSVRRKIVVGAVALGAIGGMGAIAAPAYAFSMTPSVISTPSKTVPTTTTTTASSGSISFSYDKIMW